MNPGPASLVAVRGVSIPEGQKRPRQKAVKWRSHGLLVGRIHYYLTRGLDPYLLPISF